MKIENKLKQNNIRIEDVEIGECFYYEDALHVKVDDDYMEYVDKEYFQNAVLNLEDNKLNLVKNGELVERVNAKVVVE